MGRQTSRVLNCVEMSCADLARRWKEPITLDEVPPRNVLFANYSRACSSAGRIGLYKKREIRGLRPFTLEPRLARLVVVVASSGNA
jgi:hypothetical protein